jgi:hypothetical protein
MGDGSVSGEDLTAGTLPLHDYRNPSRIFVDRAGGGIDQKSDGGRREDFHIEPRFLIERVSGAKLFVPESLHVQGQLATPRSR